ncbi:hypothetical protein HQ576_02985 [bacterium]|nr:hypothetical protein [bacterium]
MHRLSPSAEHVEKVPFGELAVRKGYCTPDDVAAAVEAQRQLGARGRPRPLLGIILVQRGSISTGQLIDLLRSCTPPAPAGDE